jgi:CBS-domain-containing membrane protein
VAGAETRVADWMTPEPDCVAPTVGVQEAFASLADRGYRHIPVVDAGTLVWRPARLLSTKDRL